MGLQAMFEAHSEGNTRPFRFLYMSGAATERDQSKTPSWMPQYSLMRVSIRYEYYYLRGHGHHRLTVLGNSSRARLRTRSLRSLRSTKARWRRA